MNRDEIKKLAKGTFFSAEFTKKDGTTRKMIARLGVTKHLKGGNKSYNDQDFNHLTVFDVQKKQYRVINLNTLKQLKIRGKVIEVENERTDL